MSRLSALVLWLLAACASGPVVAEGTPEDLQNLVLETMNRIEEVVSSHTACLQDLTITHAWELEDRAEYRTDTRTVVLRVPATARELEFSLAHEVAHHLELTCGQSDIRRAFLTAQGHTASQPWFEGNSWESTPSEQFATAFAILVTGGTDPLRDVPVTESAMEIVTRWAQDGETPESRP